MDKDIKRAEERLEYLRSDEKTIEIYKAREKSLHERANMINGAKEEGRREGIKQGIQKGIQKGVQQGIQQGAINTAKNLLVMDMEVEVISKATGLSIEEVRDLKN